MPYEQIVSFTNSVGAGLELSAGPFRANTAADLRLLQKLSTQAIRLHNYYPVPKESFVLNLSDPDEQNLSRSLEFVKGSMLLAAEFKIETYSVHAGFARSLKPSDLGKVFAEDSYDCDPVGQYKIFLQILRELASFSSKIGVQLLVENNVTLPANRLGSINPLLVSDTKDILAFLMDKPKEVGFLFDVAHFKVTHAIEGSLCITDDTRQIFKSADQFHLSDNDGFADTNHPVTPQSWFLEYLQPSSNYTLEVYRLPADKLGEQVTLINEILSKTA